MNECDYSDTVTVNC